MASSNKVADWLQVAEVFYKANVGCVYSGLLVGSLVEDRVILCGLPM